MASPLDRRLVVVTGKGGTGKTTVAAALALLAGRRGKRVAVCEVGGGRPSLAGMLGEGAGAGESRPPASRPAAIPIDPESAKREYLRRQVRSGALAGMLGHSRIFRLLTAAAPGLAELVTIGNVWDLARVEQRAGGDYDLVILDAPATGYGLALLQAPRTYASVARVGPIHRDALAIDQFLHDRALTAVLGVALPEEMPVNETLQLEAGLREEGLELDAVVVNGLHPDRFSSEEAERMAALRPRVAAGNGAALAAALSEHGRARAQRDQLRRLRLGLDAPVTPLPFLFERELGPPEVERLSRELERAL
jgi:anion-transporting  ArsA/GET3 family ATPase